jgi:hypothetical protein
MTGERKKKLLQDSNKSESWAVCCDTKNIKKYIQTNTEKYPK